VERLKAYAGGALNVLNSIIHKECPARFYTQTRQAHLEDHRVGFRNPNLA